MKNYMADVGEGTPGCICLSFNKMQSFFVKHSRVEYSIKHDHHLTKFVLLSKVLLFCLISFLLLLMCFSLHSLPILHLCFCRFLPSSPPSVSQEIRAIYAHLIEWSALELAVMFPLFPWLLPGSSSRSCRTVAVCPRTAKRVSLRRWSPR